MSIRRNLSLSELLGCKKMNTFIQPDDPIKVRWHHLALLVEFALELKVSLNGINEQSFNHFVLKMGKVYSLHFLTRTISLCFHLFPNIAFHVCHITIADDFDHFHQNGHCQLFATYET